MIQMILENLWEYFVGYNHWKTYSLSKWKDLFMYPINFDRNIKFVSKYFSPLDINGIPMKLFNKLGLQYLPSRIACYGFGHWNNYIISNSNYSLDIFMKCADWFVNSAKLHGKSIVWEHNYDWHRLKKPWISAMAQGEAISILLRAYHLTSIDKYLDIALMAYEPFTISVKHGGVRTLLSKKFIFFEEYPSLYPNHVLNGYMYSVIGIIELDRIVKLNDCIVDSCKETLENCCHYWDMGYWSSYDLFPINGVYNASSAMYHMLHVSLLRFLSEYYSSDILKNQANAWLYNHNNLTCRLRAAKDKVLYKLLYLKKY